MLRMFLYTFLLADEDNSFLGSVRPIAGLALGLSARQHLLFVSIQKRHVNARYRVCSWLNVKGSV